MWKSSSVKFAVEKEYSLKCFTGFIAEGSHTKGTMNEKRSFSQEDNGVKKIKTAILSRLSDDTRYTKVNHFPIYETYDRCLSYQYGMTH